MQKAPTFEVVCSTRVDIGDLNLGAEGISVYVHLGDKSDLVAEKGDRGSASEQSRRRAEEDASGVLKQ